MSRGERHHVRLIAALDRWHAGLRDLARAQVRVLARLDQLHAEWAALARTGAPPTPGGEPA